MKKLMRTFVLSSACLMALVQPAGVAFASGTLVLNDGFGGTAVNANVWHIPTWKSSTDGTYVGRTQFRVTQNSPLPVVNNGHVHITV